MFTSVHFLTLYGYKHANSISVLLVYTQAAAFPYSWPKHYTSAFPYTSASLAAFPYSKWVPDAQCTTSGFYMLTRSSYVNKNNNSLLSQA